MDTKKLIIPVLAGCLLAAPLAAPTNIVYAKDNRPVIYTEFIQGEYEDELLEVDHISEFTLKGIHYVSAWTKNVYEDGSTDWIPILNLFARSKSVGGYTNILIKFNPDGTYYGSTYFYSSKNKKHFPKEWDIQTDERENAWIQGLTDIYAKKNDKYYSSYRYKDIFDPKNWHATGKYPKADEKDRAMVKNIAEYIKANRPDLVQENIKLNQRDEAAALAERKAALEAEEAKAVKEHMANVQKVGNSLATLNQQQNGKPIASYLDGLNTYTWDMFLHQGASHPNVDINDLIHSVWVAEYTGPTGVEISSGSVFSRGPRTDEQKRSLLVRFEPVVFYNKDTNKIETSVLEISKLAEHFGTGETKVYNKETYELELGSYNGNVFTDSISFRDVGEKPDNGGEKRIVLTSGDSDGHFSTQMGRPTEYEFRAGATKDDFWLDELGDKEKPNGWGYHFMRLSNN